MFPILAQLAVAEATLPAWLQAVIYLAVALVGGGAVHGGKRLGVTFKRAPESPAQPAEFVSHVDEGDCRIYRDDFTRTMEDTRDKIDDLSSTVNKMSGAITQIDKNVDLLLGSQIGNGKG